MADLYDTMSTLRAVRKLRTDPIPDDVLHRVLQAACWAPTGGNTQPWRVVVVTDSEPKQALKAIYQPEWARYSAGFMERLASLPADQLAKWQRVLRPAARQRRASASTHRVVAFGGAGPVNSPLGRSASRSG